MRFSARRGSKKVSTLSHISVMVSLLAGFGLAFLILSV